MKQKSYSSLIIAALICIEIFATTYMLSSSAMMDYTDREKPNRNTLSEFDTSVNNISSNVLADIFDIPKAYTLPLLDEPAPIPNPAGYGILSDSDISTWRNTDVLYYKDETTSVKMWKEYINKTVYNFAEIEIAHPSQLRHHLAGWEYGELTKTASTLAKEVNAVVAISGDFYNYRRTGIVVQNGVLYRDALSTQMPDILFVNSDGDLLIERCSSNFDTKAYLAQNDIMFSISFGPALVTNGRVQTMDEALAYYGDGGAGYINPRAAIGQMGPLHYLLCTADGRREHSNGITTATLAQIMSDKGCYNAYNLDGGASATLVFGNEVFNILSGQGERSVADIIYIASAKPE